MSKDSRLLASIICLALLLRLPGLGASLWLDELYTSNLMVGGNVLLMKSIVTDTHPPVYFIFISFWNRVFGDSALSLRLPPLIFGLVSIVLMYRVGTRLVSRQVGLLAAFLLAISPAHIWFSTEARPYTANLLACLASVLAFYRLAQDPKRRGASAFYFFCTFCLSFIHYYAVAYVLAFSVLVLLRRPPGMKRVLALNAVLLGMVGTYLAVKLLASPMRTEANYLKPFGLLAWYKLYFQWFATGNGFDPVLLPAELRQGFMASLRGVLSPVMQLLAIGALVWGTLNLARAKPADGGESAPRYSLDALLLLVTIPAFLLVLPWIGLPQTYTERSAFSALPFFLLVIAAGLAAFSSLRGKRIALGGVLLYSLLTLFVQADLRGTWTVYKPHPDWRAAAQYFGSEIDAGGAARPLFSVYESPLTLSYYDDRLQEARTQERPEEKLAKLRGFVSKTFGEEGWLAETVSGVVESNLDEFSDYQRDLWAGREMVIYQFSGSDAASLHLAERTSDGLFYLLFHQVPGQLSYRDHPLLGRDEFAVVEELHFESLVVFKLRWEH